MCDFVVTISPSTFVTAKQDANFNWVVVSDVTGVSSGIHEFDLTATATHAYAAYNDGPWGPFKLTVEVVCDLADPSCDRDVPGMTHSFTACDSKLTPNLDL